jgi:hypothetical protein
LHVADGGADGAGAIVDKIERDIGGQGAPQLEHLALQQTNRLDHIRARLTAHVDDDGGRAVAPAAGARILQPLDNVGDILQQHRRAGARGDDELAVGLDRRELIVGGDGEGLPRAVERALGPGDIGGGDGGANVGEPEPVVR